MNKITVYNANNLKLLANEFPDRWKLIRHKNKEKWLTKEKCPTYNQLNMIAKKMKVPFGYLFLETDSLKTELAREKRIEKIVNKLNSKGYNILLCILLHNNDYGFCCDFHLMNKNYDTYRINYLVQLMGYEANPTDGSTVILDSSNVTKNIYRKLNSIIGFRMIKRKIEL